MNKHINAVSAGQTCDFQIWLIHVRDLAARWGKISNMISLTCKCYDVQVKVYNPCTGGGALRDFSVAITTNAGDVNSKCNEIIFLGLEDCTAAFSRH
jgi:hypothetical protein